MKKSSRAFARSNSTDRSKSIRSKAPVPGNCIRLRGACQHNLKNLDIDFPLHQLSVICGVSGSGKSSLAFDTLFAEGQRRYIESFSAYTRQFLQRIDKPRFESLEPLPPSIAVTRDARSRNNRSTVGTASEMMEYLRVFFANHAKLYCYECNRPVIAHTKETIQGTLADYENGTRCLIGFVVRWSDMGELASTLATLQSSGFLRLISNNSMLHLSNSTKDELATAFKGQESFVVVVDRLSWTGTIDSRWNQSITVAADQAMIYEPNEVVIWREVEQAETSVDGRHFEIDRFLFQLRCPYCDIDYPTADP
ncbi:MAG: excinuclease ABC subunit A, partial [Planctomycetes bacterium]|nr:excinuclease ABC subunit A [Planctomycetota bacterium]